MLGLKVAEIVIENRVDFAYGWSSIGAGLLPTELPSLFRISLKYLNFTLKKFGAGPSKRALGDSYILVKWIITSCLNIGPGVLRDMHNLWCMHIVCTLLCSVLCAVCGM